ncbi:MAG: hypothetical protein CMJ47_06150 [Planctomyces sp.]|nr:hypothetical protein [Planctomyces sp.]
MKERLGNDRLGSLMSRREFAQETFDAFAPFINIFDPGAKSLDGEVYHTISKADWENFRRYKKGEYVPDFSPKHDVVLNIYKPWHVEQHIFNGRPSYGTSGSRGLGFLYLDTDAHHAWQTDQERARALLEAEFPFGFFRRSGRGENGYLKVRYIAVNVFNRAADRMQDVLQRWFLHNEILCDYETKGTITTREKSGSLAKLPFHTNYEERLLLQRRWQPFEEELLEVCDHWCFYKLEEFKSKEIVSVARINRILDQIEAKIDDDKVRRFAAHKEQIRAKHEVEQQEMAKPFPRRSVAKSRRTVVSLPPSPSSLRSETDGPLGRAINGDLKPDGVIPLIGKTDLEDLRNIDNAHTRRHRFAWWLCCRLRRMATVEEALAAYREHRCFRGEWEDGLNKRITNFRAILDYIANIFDPEKYGKGERKSDRPQLEEHIRECFGIARFHLNHSGSVRVRINVRQWVDEYGQRHQTKGRVRAIDRKHAHYLHGIIRHSVASFADGAIPLEAMKALWQELAEEGKLPEWEYDYYLACRRFLERLGWIKVSGKWSKRNHKAQTCQITYERPSGVGTVYSYPETDKITVMPLTITVITQSGLGNQVESRFQTSRPPPREQPPSTRRLLTTIRSKISRNQPRETGKVRVDRHEHRKSLHYS